jgi:hypothetical protein
MSQSSARYQTTAQMQECELIQDGRKSGLVMIKHGLTATHCDVEDDNWKLMRSKLAPHFVAHACKLGHVHWSRIDRK